jgi:hypothetical protein
MAIHPPGDSVFWAPPGVLLDPGMTAKKRQSENPSCCYSWCSIAPPGTTIGR